MTVTATTEFKSLAAEDFRVGFRYWSVRPGFEQAWTVESVEIHTADYQVQRDGQWVSPELVTITYRDGRTITVEKGEQVAIQGPWFTRECPHCGAPADASGCRIPQHDPRCPTHDPNF